MTWVSTQKSGHLFLLLGENASLLCRRLVEWRIGRGLAVLVNIRERPLVLGGSKGRGFHRIDDSTLSRIEIVLSGNVFIRLDGHSACRNVDSSVVERRLCALDCSLHFFRNRDNGEHDPDENAQNDSDKEVVNPVGHGVFSGL